MDSSLFIFTLETYRFCMKYIEFTIRTYNFKLLAVGSLIWSAKTEVNSSCFLKKLVCALFFVAYRCSRQATSPIEVYFLVDLAVICF